MMNEKTSRTAFFDPDNKIHQFAAELLAKADIQIGGSQPWDIRFNAYGVVEGQFWGERRQTIGIGAFYAINKYVTLSAELQRNDRTFKPFFITRVPTQNGGLTVTNERDKEDTIAGSFGATVTC